MEHSWPKSWEEIRSGSRIYISYDARGWCTVTKLLFIGLSTIVRVQYDEVKSFPSSFGKGSIVGASVDFSKPETDDPKFEEEYPLELPEGGE